MGLAIRSDAEEDDQLCSGGEGNFGEELVYAGVKVKIKRENQRVLKGRFSRGEGAFRKVDGADAKEVVRNGKGRGRDRGREEGETKGERGRRERGENGAKQEEDGGRRDGGKFSRVRGKLSE